MLSTRAVVLLATALCASFSSAAPAPALSASAPAAPPASSPQATAGAPQGAPPGAPPGSAAGPPTSGTPSAPGLPTSTASSASLPQTSAAASGPSSQATGQSGGSSVSSSYWLANIDHSQDTVWQGQSGYKVFRDVTTYGAVGDGVHDDTVAINQAMSDGQRCGGSPNFPDCDSSTITPAIVYFPAGTYLVSKPIQMFYYTQMIGDPTNIPTLLASSDFAGMAVVDADPYDTTVDYAKNWYTNQNNFFRQVRNFVIDIRQWGGGAAGAGIHWQVAQATSLQNIVFELSTTASTQQVGVFMDNGSGGFFADLTVNGGLNGMFLGSQQFTSRNLTFNNCKTAIFMNWNWGWTLHGITVNGGPGDVALNMSAIYTTPGNDSVGSVVLADSVISGVDVGVIVDVHPSSAANPTGGSLILDNVDMSGVSKAAVQDSTGLLVLKPGKITAWASGMGYNPAAKGTNTVITSARQDQVITPAKKVASLLDSAGDIFAQTRPQYENLPASSFLSAKSNGCKGDGQTDDSAAINALLKKAAAGTNMVAYFEHGAYLVKDTIVVPPGVSMTGEVWSLIVADSASFNDASNPKVVVQVGQAGQKGNVQMSDFIFETNGPAPGAVMVEWNLQSEQGGSGMWDCHARIGGSAGTNLEYQECPRVNGTAYQPDPKCFGVFLMFHATKSSGGVYLENTWFWVADHALDADAPQQITIYSGRGVLVESQGPVWLWGTASEHSILYNYQFNGAQAVFSGLMQSETPYFQPYPLAPKPLSFNTAYDDPTFTLCQGSTSQYCQESWGLRILNSQNIVIYSTGLYSFFQNYQETCTLTNNCQDNMIHIQNSQVDMYAVNTFSAVNMIVDDDIGTVTNNDNKNWFCATLAFYFTGH